MFQAEFDDDELSDFFQAVLNRCICTKCRRNSISVFIQPDCDHRICSGCKQSFKRKKTYFCPSRTCDKRFPAAHLTPDLAFQYLWEYCSQTLDEGVFSELIKGSQPEPSDEPETPKALLHESDTTAHDNADSGSSVDFLAFPEEPGSVSQVNLQVSNAPDSVTKPYSTASKDSHGAPKEEAQCKTPNRKTGHFLKGLSKAKHEDSVPSKPPTTPTKKKRNIVTIPSKDGDCAETRSVSPSSNVRQDPSNEKITRAYAKVETPASPDANQSASADDEPKKDESYTCAAVSGNDGSVIAASPNVTQNTSAKDKPTREEFPNCAATSANSRNLGLANPQTTPSTPPTTPSKMEDQVRSQNTSSGSDITPLPNVTQNTPAKDKPTREELPNFAATPAIGGNLGQPNPPTTLSTSKMTTLSTPKTTPAKTQKTSSGDIAANNPATLKLLNDYQPKICKRVELLALEPPMVVLPCTNHDKKLLKDLKAFAARFKVNCLQEHGGFKPEITHLVVPNGTKEANFIMRMAILNGCSLVTMKWITDSLEQGRLLPAEDYEIPYPLVPNSREGYVSRRARMDKLRMAKTAGAAAAPAAPAAAPADDDDEW